MALSEEIENSSYYQSRGPICSEPIAEVSKISPGRPMPSHRVLIVDDHDSFRGFVCSMLQERPGLQIIAEASDGLEAVRKADELQPDLILLDIGLPTLDGIDAAQRISRVAPNAKVIFVTQHNDTEIARAVLSNGASGYVLKMDTRSELSPAMDVVLRGGKFLSSRVSRTASLGIGLDRIRPSLLGTLR